MAAMHLDALRGRRVTVVEVGPRDGLQNERMVLPAAARAAFIDALSDAGLPVIEVGAFVNPARVPQMADTAAVCRSIARRPGSRYVALVPNLAGLERAAAAGIRDIAIFAAATDGFSQRNINRTVAESLTLYAGVCEQALTAGMRVRAYLSVCFGCPYQGDVPPAVVGDLAQRLLDMGVFEVAVSDTIGVAHPGQVREVLDVLLASIDADRLALHFHDTRGTALANVLAGLLHGIATFDASAGGLGGCPFAPGASGNLATEDLIYTLDGLGVETGVSLDRVLAASASVAGYLDHPLPSRYVQARASSASRTASVRPPDAR